MKKWTITSPNGQTLNAEEIEGNQIMMSSVKGNHGTVTMDVFLAQLDKMIAAGYTVITK